MTALTRWVLAHKRLVVAFWVVLTLVGGAAAGPASKALKQKFSVPGKEGWQTNQQIAHLYKGTGDNSAPLVPVVQLPAGTSSSPSRRRTTGPAAILAAPAPEAAGCICVRAASA